MLGLPKLNCTGSFDWTYKVVWLLFQDHKTSKLTSIISIWCFWIMNSFYFASAPVFNQNLQFLQTFRWQICFWEHSWDVNAREVSTDCLNAIQASKKYHQTLSPFSSIICCLGWGQWKAGASADVSSSNTTNLGHPLPAPALSWSMSQLMGSALSVPCRAHRLQIQTVLICREPFQCLVPSPWHTPCWTPALWVILGAPLHCSASTPAFVCAACLWIFILIEADLQVPFMQMNKMRRLHYREGFAADSKKGFFSS